MTQDEALQLMSPRLYSLLRMMFAMFANYRPKIGYPVSSAGFNSGGSVLSFDDLEIAVDSMAVEVIETAWDGLSLSERTCIEMAIGIQPWVWTPRAGVMEAAIEKLEKKLRTIGGVI